MKHPIFMLAFVCCIGNSARAGDLPGNGMFGLNSVRAAGQPCKVDSTLDLQSYLQAVPQLKEIGVLNPEYVTQTRINMQPATLSMAFLLQMAPLTTRGVFDDDPTTASCTFAAYLMEQDDYGNDKKELAFSYQFNRTLYGKINWDKFSVPKFPGIAPAFLFGRSLQSQIASERLIGPE